MQKKALIIYLVFIVYIPLCLAGCGSSLSKALFQEQEWSGNYALDDGVRCNVPEVIDGDLNTVGKILFPEKLYNTSVLTVLPSAEADIILPEKKSIRKIVIHSDELPTFSVLAATGQKDQWQVIKEFDNNDQKEIVIRTSVVTDTIKIRAKAKVTFDGLSARRVGIGQTAKITEPEIKEIELYGFK